MTDWTKFAREIHRRRTLAGDKSKYPRSVAEMGVLKRYGQEPSINDLEVVGSEIFVCHIDLDGNRFGIVDGGDEHWEVPDSLNCDSFVFVRSINTSSYDISGWLTSKEVFEAPHVDSRYQITSEHLWPMPNEMSFKPLCPQFPCRVAAIWDWDTDSWDCFGCGRHRYDRDGSEWWPAYLAKSGNKNEEREEGV